MGAERKEVPKRGAADVQRTCGKSDEGGVSGILKQEIQEKYEFTWPGKQKAAAEAAGPAGQALYPCTEESICWDSTHNFYLEGDNLAVLKLLQDACRKDGMTVVVITHNQALTAMADRIITVKSGTVHSMEMNERIVPVEEIEW